jgi:hypothetical protein
MRPAESFLSSRAASPPFSDSWTRRAPAQALYDSLTRASSDFAADVSARCRTGSIRSAEVFRALTAADADNGQWAEIQKNYYQRHLELWSTLAQAGAAAESSTRLQSSHGKGDRRFSARMAAAAVFATEAGLPLNSLVVEVVEAAQLDVKTKTNCALRAR